MATDSRTAPASGTLAAGAVGPSGGVTAASLTLFPLLAGPRRSARVVAIEPGAVYLQLDPADGEPDGADRPADVVALLDHDQTELPFGMMLPAAAAEFLPVLVAGTPVGRGPITIGWGAISVAGTRWPVLHWWNPAVPVLELPPAALAAGPGATQAEEEPATVELEQIPGIREGLAALSSGQADLAVPLLTGVGPGLVPTGDEVLCAALAALAAWAPESRWRRVLAEAVAGAANRTGVVGAALLRSAVEGCAVPELSGLLRAFSTDSRPEVDCALDRLAGAGFGSPAAMTAGLLGQRGFLQGDPRRRAA